MRSFGWMGLSVVLFVGIGCSDTDGGESSAAGGAGGAGGSGGASDVGGMPCDVQALLTSKCVACHGDPPALGVPMSLLSYADLAAPSLSDPSKSYAELAVTRMMMMSKGLMPPMPNEPATAAEVAALQAWIAAGLPRAECAMNSEPDPFSGPRVCSSNIYWTEGNPGVGDMDPGRACIACHASKPEGKSPPVFRVAGTVYATGHEPDLCFGGALDKTTPVLVEITDANGKPLTLPAYSGGNFFLNPGSPIALPYTAKVRYNGKERAMKTPQEVGDCNSCHTQDGANGAPGRIVIP
jgi:mono/diheme cytochrome c family protein